MSNKKTETMQNPKKEIILPEPKLTGKISVEETIYKRRSVREFKDEALTLEEVSQILWAAQGITESEWGGKSAPSAGALYPLEIYLIVRKAENIEPGVYLYLPKEHRLKYFLGGDINIKLSHAALGQSCVAEAPVNLVVTGIYERTTKKYGERGIRYVYIETGHAAQNVCLQVISLGLATVTVGAFYDDEVKKLLNLEEEKVPLYIMPVGKPKQ